MTAEIVNGYRIQNLMGTGQTSQVFEVVEVVSHRHFAMKTLLPEYVNSREHRNSLFHEAAVGLKLAHPNVIRIFSVSKDKAFPHFIMEFFPAGSLKLRIMHKQTDFIYEKAHDIFRQAATALAYMNASGYIHRDVKPDNILVNSAGEVRLIDFALAERPPSGIGKLFYRRKRQVQGTRSYMSPEQIRGQILDGRADIYSFGATAYEIVTGRPPFRGRDANDLLNKHLAEKPVTPKVHNPDISDEFADLVLKMLAKKRDDRPRTFHDVLIALRSMKVFKNQPAKKAEAE